MLTKDSVTVAVDAVVYYRIWLPTIAVANVYDYGNATRLLTSTTLRNVLGTKTLTEILSERENISLAVRAILDEVTKVWGKCVCALLRKTKRKSIARFDADDCRFVCVYSTGSLTSTLFSLFPLPFLGVKVERVEM